MWVTFAYHFIFILFLFLFFIMRHTFLFMQWEGSATAKNSHPPSKSTAIRLSASASQQHLSNQAALPAVTTLKIRNISNTKNSSKPTHSPVRWWNEINPSLPKRKPWFYTSSILFGFSSCLILWKAS
jgi:hypothetical protein